MKLKKFIKHFDTMTKIHIMEFPWKGIDKGISLFEGNVYDDGAKEVLKQLYKEKYVLERNEDGESIMIFTKKNEHGVVMAEAQINVRKKNKK